MKKILLTATLISTLLSCTTKESRDTTKLIAMADYRMEVPSAPSQIGFENILTSNVNFQYISDQTNTLSDLKSLPRNINYTMLAPMDYAFAKAEDSDSFKLENYIIQGTWTRRDIDEALLLKPSMKVKTLSGVELTFRKNDNKLYVSNDDREIQLIFTDLETKSNTLHVISELW
ncbi:fasciclin domain-containing protein [Dokdonia sp. Hel_I_53]|uniref:fasciclin domain-containing protein n=1 Tax=Dokdonia sp. Hel_I_53 TaxID=1566287 RepID=UPI00119B3CFF|nr:fasciclin domain-containing protein [Dokdonia sp. Hel_I_53]TVZ51168.1 fasciclin domain-containing protein [Dokdonia sp. Hel_I_53]